MEVVGGRRCTTSLTSLKDCVIGKGDTTEFGLVAMAFVPFALVGTNAQAQDRNCDNFPFVTPELAVTATLTGSEREVLAFAIQIMSRIWNSDDGVLCHQVNGSGLSNELQNAILCPSFFPLVLAVESLYVKVTTDQQRLSPRIRKGPPKLSGGPFYDNSWGH